MLVANAAVANVANLESLHVDRNSTFYMHFFHKLILSRKALYIFTVILKPVKIILDPKNCHSNDLYLVSIWCFLTF